MKTTKHTPGPWSCDYGDFSVFDDAGAEVARITPGKRDDGTFIQFDEMERNMMLVMAAPDLLEALSLLIDAAVSVYDGQAGDFPQLAAATEAACAALDKAEGRT